VVLSIIRIMRNSIYLHFGGQNRHFLASVEEAGSGTRYQIYYFVYLRQNHGQIMEDNSPCSHLEYVINMLHNITNSTICVPNKETR